MENKEDKDLDEDKFDEKEDEDEEDSFLESHNEEEEWWADIKPKNSQLF